MGLDGQYRPLVARALALACGLAGPAAAECRLALALGMDVSASVDAGEYALMMQGTANALRSEGVRAALLSGAPVAVAAFLWSGAREQAVVARWTVLDSDAAIEAFAAQVAGFPRPSGDPAGRWAGRTAVGSAMLAGLNLLAQAPACDAQTLDLAGDGESNDGPAPGPLRARMGAVTVNALAIGPLEAWFQAHVLHGPLSFVETARDHGDVERAMTRKLERELHPPLLGLNAPER